MRDLSNVEVPAGELVVLSPVSRNSESFDFAIVMEDGRGLKANTIVGGQKCIWIKEPLEPYYARVKQGILDTREKWRLKSEENKKALAADRKKAIKKFERLNIYSRSGDTSGILFVGACSLHTQYQDDEHYTNGWIEVFRDTPTSPWKLYTHWTSTCCIKNIKKPTVLHHLGSVTEEELEQMFKDNYRKHANSWLSSRHQDLKLK